MKITEEMFEKYVYCERFVKDVNPEIVIAKLKRNLPIVFKLKFNNFDMMIKWLIMHNDEQYVLKPLKMFNFFYCCI